MRDDTVQAGRNHQNASSQDKDEKHSGREVDIENHRGRALAQKGQKLCVFRYLAGRETALFLQFGNGILNLKDVGKAHVKHRVVIGKGFRFFRGINGKETVHAENNPVGVFAGIL